MTAVDPALRATRTTCPYCGVGCGILATPEADGGAAISGDPEHPANFGRLCSKGSALGETLGLEERLLYPMIRCSKGIMERVAWSDALDQVAGGFRRIVARDGPDAIAFYLSGQLLTEDYYVANKLMKGFIGSANVDTNSRLCMSSTVAGHRRAFGADTVPGCYEDLDQADLLVLVGSNAAWCHPVLFQRMLANKHQRDRAGDGPFRAGCRRLLSDVWRYAAGGHAVFARRQPVGAGHRQGQCHHQLPSRHGADRQAGRVTVLADRATQCDGWARGRRPRQSARRAYGFYAARHRP